MIDGLLSLCFLLAAPAVENSVEFQVVGVYRPVELAGRVVNSPREVYLQSTTEDRDISGFVGVTLEVLRRSPVPATVHMRERFDKLDEKVQAQNASGRGQAKAKTSVGRTGGALKLKPSPKLSSIKDGKPAGFVSKAKKNTVGSPVYLGADVPGGDRIAALKGPAVKTETIERAIGRVKVISVQGDVAIALVVNDGLDVGNKRSKNRLVPDEIPTVMAGDVARGLPRIRGDKLGHSKRKLSARSKAKLAKERRQVERAVKRRKSKPKPFVRKRMQWDL